MSLAYVMTHDTLGFVLGVYALGFCALGYTLGVHTHVAKSICSDDSRARVAVDASDPKFERAFSELRQVAFSKDETPSRERLLHTLIDLRASERFQLSWRPEYDVLWIACFEPSGRLERETLRKRCVERGLPPSAVKDGEPVTVTDLVRNLLVKMRD